jgi:hypothetical protein
MDSEAVVAWLSAALRQHKRGARIMSGSRTMPVLVTEYIENDDDPGRPSAGRARLYQ